MESVTNLLLTKQVPDMIYRHDTIAAIATAPGNSGIGIIRISGADAKNILMKIFRPAGTQNRVPESHRMMYGILTDGEDAVDECMAVFMHAPYSFMAAVM